MPIRYDADAGPGNSPGRLLLVFTPAPRCPFNISGIYPMPPLGVAYLAAYLRKHRFRRTAVLDMTAHGLTVESVMPILKRDAFDVYGLSATVFGLSEVAVISRRIKSAVNPNALVVLGGPGTRFSPDVLLRHLPHVDVVVGGAGEGPLLEIVRRVQAGEPVSGIPGTSHRAASGGVATAPAVDLPGDYHSGPPARDLLPMERYRMHPPFGIFPPATTVETARGCSFNCGFCSIPRRLTARSVDDVIGELRDLAAGGYREIYFTDPTFPLDRERTVALCEGMIAEGLRLQWSCKSRVDTLDAALLRLMGRAGCYMISLGVESGSDRLLQSLQKGITVERTRKCLRDCRRAGIRALAYALVGAPGETDATVRDVVRLLIDEKAAFALFGELVADPEARMYRDGQRCGHEEALARYYIAGDRSPETLRQLELTSAAARRRRAWLEWANRAFYLRPAYVARRLAELHHPGELVMLGRGFFDMVREACRVRRSKGGLTVS